jgi:hypothetical protein
MPWSAGRSQLLERVVLADIELRARDLVAAPLAVDVFEQA